MLVVAGNLKKKKMQVCKDSISGTFILPWWSANTKNHPTTAAASQ